MWFISQKLFYLFFTEDWPKKSMLLFHNFKIQEYYLIIILLTDCILSLFKNIQYCKTKQMVFSYLKEAGCWDC